MILSVFSVINLQGGITAPATKNGVMGKPIPIIFSCIAMNGLAENDLILMSTSTALLKQMILKSPSRILVELLIKDHLHSPMLEYTNLYLQN